jgi:AraC-like DNA-binding protein
MILQSESIKIFELPFFPGVEAISGSHIVNDFRRHIHTTYIVGIVKQGRRIITCPDSVSRIAENEMFVINPDQVHACSSESQSGHSYKILSVSSRVMQSIASQISERHEEKPCFKRIHVEDDALSGKFIRLFDALEEPESDIHIEGGIYSFLAYLLLNFSESPPVICTAGEQRDSIQRTCDYIRKNFRENISLAALAAVACLSPFHFQREFRKSIGITPHEYLNDIRINESKKMLLGSDEIADIAIRVGFFDQSHFSRIFRKTVGIPPGKYRTINLMRLPL